MFPYPTEEFRSSRIPDNLRARNALRDLAVQALFESGPHHSGHREYLQRQGDVSHRLTRPGAMIEAQPMEMRQLLSELRSEDLAMETGVWRHWPQVRRSSRRSAMRLPGSCLERQS